MKKTLLFLFVCMPLCSLAMHRPVQRNLFGPLVTSLSNEKKEKEFSEWDLIQEINDAKRLRERHKERARCLTIAFEGEADPGKREEHRNKLVKETKIFKRFDKENKQLIARYLRIKQPNLLKAKKRRIARKSNLTSAKLHVRFKRREK